MSAVSDSPFEDANRAVEDARRAGDRRKEAAALTDLGILWVQSGDLRLAANYLVSAIQLAVAVNDKSLEADALGHLGVATAQTGHVGPALELLERSLAVARSIGDQFGEKAALARLVHASASAKQTDRAAVACGQAIALALELGDRADEAELRWTLAILEADRGNSGVALAEADAAAALYGALRHPHAAGFTEQLKQYRAGASALAAPAPAWQVSLTSAGAWSEPTAAQSPARGPGLLRMAMTAAKAMTRFVGSGLKTVPQDVRDARLACCAPCEHHTGIRCRLCGCFTVLKSRLPHETCPAGRWHLPTS